MKNIVCQMNQFYVYVEQELCKRRHLYEDISYFSDEYQCHIYVEWELEPGL